MQTLTSSVTTGEHWSVCRAHCPPVVSLSAFIIHRKVLIMSNCRSPEVNWWPESCWTDSLDFLYTCFRVLEPISIRSRLERSNSDTFVPDKRRVRWTKWTHPKGSFRFGSSSALLISTPVRHPDTVLALSGNSSPRWTGNIENICLIILIFKVARSQ